MLGVPTTSGWDVGMSRGVRICAAEYMLWSAHLLRMLPEAESLSNVPFRADMDRKEVRVDVIGDHVKINRYCRERPSRGHAFTWTRFPDQGNMGKNCNSELV